MWQLSPTPRERAWRGRSAGRSPGRLRDPARVVGLLAAGAVAVLSGIGCQKTVTSDRPERIVRTVDGGGAGGEAGVTAPGGGNGGGNPTAQIALDAADPCDANLHELSGLLLEHWLNHRRLPGSLEELRPLADPVQANAFTCPFAKKPYAYLPQASRMVGAVPRLVVYAPAAGPDGRHRAILMRVPQGSQLPATWVVKLTQIELQGQLGSMPPAAAVVPSTRPAP
jgi:hypothetical protein